ncbi:MAG: bifunctional methylenetetrahydrofolate dehydrogenase/methenyltetrahydrofolate cyclohydrolase FolD [bacterium]
MSATIIDGKIIAETIRSEIKQEVIKLKAQGLTPGLGVVLVGLDPASHSYVTAKERACAEIGIFSDNHRLPATTPQSELLALVEKLNRDPRIHGILVQLPLPKPLHEREILQTMDPDKDVDGFHPTNIGRMLIGERAFWPCTPHAVLQILKRSGIAIDGAHVVIVGRSHVVGTPLANLLLQKGPLGNATVTVCHTRTRDMGFFTRQADIVVAAAGRPNTITADMIREGAVVIDVGVNRIPDATKKQGFRLAGDVDFDAVKQKASFITPVPGGVGPMTITMLLHNTVLAAKRQHGM